MIEDRIEGAAGLSRQRLPGGEKQVDTHTFRAAPRVTNRLRYGMETTGYSKTRFIQQAILIATAFLEAEQRSESLPEAMARAFFEMQLELPDGDGPEDD